MHICNYVLSFLNLKEFFNLGVSGKYCVSQTAKEALTQRLNHVRALIMPPSISPVDNSTLLNTILHCSM